MQKSRPIGVTIVAILMIISGILFLVGGTGLVVFIPPIGVPLIIIGIANLVLAWGLFKGKGWAWIITVILAIISVILSIVSIASGGRTNIISLIISAVILYYMYRTEVKSYFGRGTRLAK